jgi:hypothetical protein
MLNRRKENKVKKKDKIDKRLRKKSFKRERKK